MRVIADPTWSASRRSWYEGDAALSTVTHGPGADRIYDGLTESGAVVFRSYRQYGAGQYETAADYRV